MTRNVDGELAELQHFALRLRLGMHAAQKGAYASNQFARAEGLDKIVVCTQFEADNAVFHFTFGGEHDDGRVGVVADNAAYTLTGNTREHQVEYNQIEVMLGKLFQSLLAVTHGSYPIALAFEICRHRIADGLFVFHEKDTTSAFVH